MKTLRPTSKFRTIFHEGRLFVIYKATYGKTGRPRTTSSPEYRVFELTEGNSSGALLTFHWIGSVPTMQRVKGLVEEFVRHEELEGLIAEQQ